MKQIRLILLAAAVLTLGAAWAQDLSPALPSGYVNASELLPLPEFIPGAGALYIDPANAPVGPWLSYGNDGKLVEVLFMVPVSQMTEGANWDDLAAGTFEELGISTLDHVDITFNPGHAGMAEAHYHFRLALIDHESQQAALSE
ncbi:MAG TPA: hypothetical protein VF168_04150 [Trueperaceae bacterium]